VDLSCPSVRKTEDGARRGGENWLCESTRGLAADGATGVCAAQRLAGNDEAGILPQHRAVWSHHGGTWWLPGGTRITGAQP